MKEHIAGRRKRGGAPHAKGIHTITSNAGKNEQRFAAVVDHQEAGTVPKGPSRSRVRGGKFNSSPQGRYA